MSDLASAMLEKHRKAKAPDPFTPAELEAGVLNGGSMDRILATLRAQQERIEALEHAIEVVGQVGERRR